MTARQPQPGRARRATGRLAGRVAARVTGRATGRPSGGVAGPANGHAAPSPSPSPRPRVVAALRDVAVTNLGLKLLSLILALTVFLLVNSDRDREITMHVGVSYTLPDDKVLVSERLPEVRVTVRGPWRLLRRFDEREIDRLNLDLTRVTGGEVPIAADMVRVPAGLTVVSVSPRSFRVAFEKRTDKTVAVAVATSGRPLHGFAVSAITVVPPTVSARGAQGVIAALSSIRGREIRVDGRSDSFEVDTELLPPEGVELAEGARVSVRIEIKEELVSRRVGPLPVQVKGDGIDLSRYRVRPSQVDVTLTGALLAVERAVAAGLVAQLRMTAAEVAARNDGVVVVTTAVPGVGVTITPPRVRLQRK